MYNVFQRCSSLAGAHTHTHTCPSSTPRRRRKRKRMQNKIGEFLLFVPFCGIDRQIDRWRYALRVSYMAYCVYGDVQPHRWHQLRSSGQRTVARIASSICAPLEVHSYTPTHSPFDATRILRVHICKRIGIATFCFRLWSTSCTIELTVINMQNIIHLYIYRYTSVCVSQLNSYWRRRRQRPRSNTFASNDDWQQTEIKILEKKKKTGTERDAWHLVWHSLTFARAQIHFSYEWQCR